MKALTKISIFLLFCFVLSLTSVLAQSISVKQVDEGLQPTEAREKDSGQHLWQSKLNIRSISHEGRAFLYLEDIGSGIYGKDKQDLTWHTTSYILKEGDKLIPYQVKVIFRDKQGKVVRKLEKYYDSKTKKVICLSDDGERKFDLKPDLVDKEILGIILRNYPFENTKEIKFHLLTHEPTMYKITMKNKGREMIDGVDCYKLEMIPDLGALSIFGAFVPKTYFWYSVEEPREFVRYEGLESGLGTPYIILEPPKGDIDGTN